MLMKPIQFDPDFASAADYAKLYRQLGLQAVPSHSPLDSPKNWKRPLLSTWKEFESTPVPDSQFDKWFGWDGSHKTKTNIGLITGSCSGGAFILDVDSHKHPEAQEWLMNLLDSYNDGNRLTCPTQQTGGGGFQYLLRAPEGWTPPTIKTPIGIDIRGQGGFAVMPPSVHDSGDEYKWLKGSEPWTVDIPEAAGWLTAEIDLLVQKYGAGSTSGAGQQVTTPTPQYAKTEFGQIVDGREEYMTKIIFAKVLSLYRESPIMPSAERLQDAMREAFGSYERNVKSRIPERGTPNHILLEREGRGHSLFCQKWHYALKQWDDKVAREAAMPRTKGDGVQTEVGEFEGEWTPLNDVYEILSVSEIKSLPDPVFLVKDMVIENSLGFIYGTAGSGKSFIALGMALSIATGQKQWWNRDVNKTGAVLVISSEGTADMKYRIEAWQKANQTYDEPEFYLIRQTINFMNLSDYEKLDRSVEFLTAKINKNPILIIVDTLSRAMAGEDENDQASASGMVTACDKLREKWNCTVLCIHHTSRNGNMRGSTVFEGAADFIFHVEREQGSQVGVMTAKKIKAAEDGWQEQFNLRKVPVGKIEENRESLIAEPALNTRIIPTATNEWPERSVINAMLNALQQAWDEGHSWSSKPQTRREGRYAVQHMVRYGVGEDMAEKVLQSWLDNQIVVYEVCDSHSKSKGLRCKNTPYKSAEVAAEVVRKFNEQE